MDARRTYDLATLDEAAAARDPHEQFARWWSEAIASDLREPHAMTLATVSPDGRPSARIVLLRGHDERGFVFFTNYASRKARELDASSHAALLFYWDILERQVRIEGAVERLSAEESDAYFLRRPRGHRLSAWASEQSAVVPDRKFLEAEVGRWTERFADREVERPPHWGGYRVAPESVEFWQGRPDRLHDRLRYTCLTGKWRIERLAP